MSYPLLENQTEVLEYLRGRFPMFHNSNLFFRDFQYGIQQFLNARGDHVGYAEAETRAREFCGALERQEILIPIDGQTWTLNYPPFKTPERKKPAEPGSSARGSGALLGFVDIILELTRYSRLASDARCRVLSGGEKARLVMAKMLFDPPNFLVLDEPTNHLDLATKEMLIKALSDFEGTMLFVSHDRHFLSELSNRVLELTPEGIHQYGGGYTEYVARTGQEAPGLRS